MFTNIVRAEFRKLLTVRSTYAILGITFLLLLIFAFYGQGYRIAPSELLDKNYFYNQSQQGILLVALLGALVGVLITTHEYRYNTIIYTFAAARSRTQVLFAKAIVVSVFAVTFALSVGILAPLLAWLGVRVHGGTLIPQHIDFVRLLWHDLFVGWAYCLLAFIFAVIIRTQAGSICAFLLFPALLEPLLSLALKKDAIYLPYSATQSLLETNSSLGHISGPRAVGVVTLYIIVGLLIGWFLFLRRDASS